MPGMVSYASNLKLCGEWTVSATHIKYKWQFLFREARIKSTRSPTFKQEKACAFCLTLKLDKSNWKNKWHLSRRGFGFGKIKCVTHVPNPHVMIIPSYPGENKYLLSKFLLSDRLVVILNFCRIILFLKPLFPFFHLLCTLNLLSS